MIEKAVAYKVSSINKLRQFALKLGVFILIPLFGNLLLVVLTPPNLFSFRAWEALTPFTPGVFSGPFYPSQKIHLTEYGDLGVGTGYAVPKNVIFATDGYGYRYNHEPRDRYDVVIVGDSFTVGSSLSQ